MKEMTFDENGTTEKPECNVKPFVDRAKEWFEKHQTACFIGGGVILTAALVYFLKQAGVSEETIIEVVKPFHNTELSEQVKELKIKRAYTIPQETVFTRMHPRTLPIGQHASQKKLEEAAALGIVLAENQTLVDGYPRYN